MKFRSPRRPDEPVGAPIFEVFGKPLESYDLNELILELNLALAPVKCKWCDKYRTKAERELNRTRITYVPPEAKEGPV